MSATALRDLGLLLFGEHWIDRMSTELSVNARTIRRWASGSQAMPRGVLEDIDEMIAAHLGDIVLMRGKLIAQQIAREETGSASVDH
jgi:hypothetical protein